MILDIAKIADLAEDLRARAEQLETDAAKMRNDADGILDLLEVRPMTRKPEPAPAPEPEPKPEPEPEPEPRVVAPVMVSKAPALLTPRGAWNDVVRHTAVAQDMATDFDLGDMPEFSADEGEEGMFWICKMHPNHGMIFLHKPTDHGDVPDFKSDMIALSYHHDTRQVSIGIKRNGITQPKKKLDTFAQILQQGKNLIGVEFADKTKRQLWTNVERLICFMTDTNPYGLDNPIDTVDNGGLNIVSRRTGKYIKIEPCLNAMPGTPCVDIAPFFGAFDHQSLLRIIDTEGGDVTFDQLILGLGVRFDQKISTHSAMTLKAIIRDGFLPRYHPGTMMDVL